jgi:3-hydroxymyristoyl/3-hydroxydecanoyl-(acyl carrier protein) dehydratase
MTIVHALEGGFTVPAGHPCLPGHFPGDPIVPAVVLLELSCAVLRELRPELGPLREIRMVKFTRPVRPGEPVRVSFTALAAGGLRFSCATAAGVAAQGQMLFGASA